MNVEQEVVRAVIAVILLVGVGRLLGMICQRFRVPDLVGYVVAGMIFGPHAIGGRLMLFDVPIVELDGLLSIFSQIAAIIILFAAGLHFTFTDLRKVGLKASIVSGIEFLLSISLAFYVSLLFGLEWTVAAIIATTFGATSIAVSVTVLEELKKEKNREAKLLVNVAVLDDILGLAVLSAVTALILANAGLEFGSIFLSTGGALAFWIMLVLAAVFFLPKIMKMAKLKGTAATTDVAAIGSAFGFSSIATLLGLNPIVGAFAAGMGLASSHIGKHVREYVESLKYVAAPLFFAIIGANVDLTKIGDLSIVMFLILLAVAVTTKIFGAGMPSSILLKNKNHGLKVGLGMIARSEVAFITAGVGLATGIIDNNIYSTLALVILATVFISPLSLRQAYLKSEKTHD